MTFNVFHLAAWYLVFVFSTTLHEAAHALVAWKLGDPTAYHGGQVTLDPRPHMKREPWGMIWIPLLTFMINKTWMIGWASAPYDPEWAWRYPKRAAWMALAGPASNLLLVIISFILIRIGLNAGVFYAPMSIDFTNAIGAQGPWQGIALLLSVMFSLNLVLFVFNLLPLPPMDGSAALPLILSENATQAWMILMRQPAVMLIGMIAAWNGFGYIFRPIFLTLINLLYPGSYYR
ncbi:site-2 protease family protein [bacterium]|nr:site-2 protease family protein [bacterium]